MAIPVHKEYNFLQAAGFFYSPFAQLVGGMAEYIIGQFYDGNIFSIGMGPRVKVSSHFELEGYYGYNHARFPKRDQQLTTHLARLKILYIMDTKFSIAAFLQYNSLEKIYTGNIRLRYNPKEGKDLYVVYNDQLNGNRKREVPHLPFSSARTVVVKYMYTFGW